MNVGDKVNRIENREQVSSTIIEINGDQALISYDEGGSGWWPITSLEARITTLEK